MSEQRAFDGTPCSRRGGEVTFRRADGSEWTRAITAVERALMTVIDDAITRDLHGVWHRVADLLQSEDAEETEAGIERLRAEFPGWIEVAACDDDYYTSSDLIL